ncbi:hypothetical protein RRF57_008096 [Xylaria bambusicola]|uniref:MAGE domain-containing protein n=1 Tax=Xylaria bambusicola TaxID=326684 RepID=A0AAN7UNS8_9PEZI
MPPQGQRRRRAGHDEGVEEDDNSHHRRPTKRVQESDNGSDDSENDGEQDIDMDRAAGDNTSDDQLVKKLVRYALACEYARLPIKRDGIRDKGIRGFVPPRVIIY